MKKKKSLIIIIIVTIILLFSVGVTYTIFNYSRTGTNNSQLVVGDIYMHYNETNQLTITNAMPYNVDSYKHNSNISEEEVNLCVNYLTNIWAPEEDNTRPGETYESFCQGTGTNYGDTFQQLLDMGWFNDEDLIYFEENNIIKSPFIDLPYFEFTIDGKNTYTEEDIWYEIVLSHGDTHATRTERLRDDLLKFRLVEVVDGEEQELFTNHSYNDLTSKRVWVDTIPRNTTNEIVHTYRLYMWISDSIRIGNTSEVDYDMETWNNEVYASIKVNVTGDFNEKIVETDASCFTTEINDSSVTITEYDIDCGTDVVIPKTINGYSVTAIGDYAFNNNRLTSVVIPDSVTSIGDRAFLNNILTSVVIPDSVISIGEAAFSSNYLETVELGVNVQIIGKFAFTIAPGYDANANLSKVINKSGNVFNWDNIFKQTSIDGNSTFATGTYIYYFGGNREILITAE